MLNESVAQHHIQPKQTPVAANTPQSRHSCRDISYVCRHRAVAQTSTTAGHLAACTVRGRCRFRWVARRSKQLSQNCPYVFDRNATIASDSISTPHLWWSVAVRSAQFDKNILECTISYGSSRHVMRGRLSWAYVHTLGYIIMPANQCDTNACNARKLAFRTYCKSEQHMNTAYE